jgi:hypothetical protein
VGRDDDVSSSYPWPDVSVGHWGAPRLPFPVTATYRPRPDLVRLGGVAHGRVEREVLDADADAPATLMAKLARLRRWPERCVAIDPALALDLGAVWARVGAASNAIVAARAGGASAVAVAARPDAASGANADAGAVPAEAGPAMRGAADGPIPDAPASPLERAGDEILARVAGWAFPADPRAPFSLRALRPDAVPVLDWIASRPPAERPLHALALALQEDLAWMEAAPGEPARARLLHVCFPSGWDPAAKIGRDFASIHAPVADAELLQSSALALSRALTSQGPFVRFVWTVAPDGARPRHPADAPAPAAVDATSPWFRCERQVSLPMPPGAAGDAAAALFLIRLHLAPLADAAHTPERLATLRAALDSMSPATLAYKGLDARLDALRRWLDARAGG